MSVDTNFSPDEGYGIAALFLEEEKENGMDSELRKEVNALRNQMESIQDRLNSFETKLNDLSSSKTNSVFGPINKLIDQESEPENFTTFEIDDTNEPTPAETELNKVFDEYNNEPEEVHSLKRQLEDKLRKAEVEMSIQRARVFQQKAELEAMKLQLEEREAAIRKSASSHQSDRWDRHLGFFRKKEEATEGS